MKKVALIVALAITAPAWAQEAKPPAEAAKPAAAPEAPKAEAPKAEAPKAKAPRKVQVHPAKRQEDARHCLEKPSNTEIIKCAEAYL